MNEVINKFVRWLFFGVLASLVPLLCSYLNLVMKHKPTPFDAIMGDGGLLLIISAICAGALGEVIRLKLVRRQGRGMFPGQDLVEVVGKGRPLTQD